MPPIECKMPDLAHVAPSLLRCLAPRLLAEDGNNTTWLVLRNYARLVDLAIDEYQRARSAILLDNEEPKRPAEEIVNTGRFIYTIAFANHFEACINQTTRILKNLQIIKNDHEIRIDRVIRKQVESVGEEFIEARNTVEHMDEEIRAGGWVSGQPIFPMPSTDGTKVTIREQQVDLGSLSALLEKLHAIGYQMITGQSQPAATPSHRPSITFVMRIENRGKDWY